MRVQLVLSKKHAGAKLAFNTASVNFGEIARLAAERRIRGMPVNIFCPSQLIFKRRHRSVCSIYLNERNETDRMIINHIRTNNLNASKFIMECLDLALTEWTVRAEKDEQYKKILKDAQPGYVVSELSAVPAQITTGTDIADTSAQPASVIHEPTPVVNETASEPCETVTVTEKEEATPVLEQPVPTTEINVSEEPQPQLESSEYYENILRNLMNTQTR